MHVPLTQPVGLGPLLGIEDTVPAVIFQRGDPGERRDKVTLRAGSWTGQD